MGEDPRPGATTLSALLRDSATRWPNARMVVDERAATVAELDARADVWAARLVAAGIVPGDHVGILLDPSLDYLELLFGIGRAGGVIVPISDRFKTSELRHVIVHADLRLLVTTDRTARHVGFPDLLRNAFPDLDGSGRELVLRDAPLLRRILLLGGEPPCGFTSPAELDALPTEATAALAATRGPGDPAFIMYTSGTSAEPKACLLTHRSFTLQGAAIAHTRYLLEVGDSFWCPLPMFHNGGICTLMACLSAGADYCHSGRYEPGRALRQLERERCTHGIPAFEAIWLPLLDHPDFPGTDLSALRAIVHSGSPERLRQLQARLPGAVLISNYGLTEAAGHLTMTRRDDPLDVRAETCGTPLPGMEVRIVDPESRVVLPPDAPGEIEFRGPLRVSGYFKAPELQQAAFDADGWFRTGDLGTLDAEGRVRFGGRLKDMLKVGGENVSAAEVEAFLLRHPAVRIAVVVGAPDARYDEVPAAFIQCKAGATATPEEIVAFRVGEIATFKVPRYVRFVQSWPMSGTKIKKFVLREQLAAELQTGDEPPLAAISPP